MGESGCGKSTLARLITMIEPPTAGSFRIGDTVVDKDEHIRADSTLEKLSTRSPPLEPTTAHVRKRQQ